MKPHRFLSSVLSALSALAFSALTTAYRVFSGERGQGLWSFLDAPVPASVLASVLALAVVGLAGLGPRPAAAQQPKEDAKPPSSRPADALEEYPQDRQARGEPLWRERLRENRFQRRRILPKAVSAKGWKQSEASLVTRASVGLTGVELSSTSIADVDGDGNQDLLVIGQDANENSKTTLYLGDGTGEYTEGGAGLTGVKYGSTSIADVDGDGNQDLLITGEDTNENPTTTLYLGDGTGEYTEAGADLTGVYRSSTSIADVDGDGNLDLLTTGRDANYDPTTTLYLGDGTGGFSEAGAGLTNVQFGSTSIADVDGDGNQDLLITGYDANYDPTTTLYLSDGTGGFTKAGAGLTGVKYGSTSIADVDGDGNQDLLITGRDINDKPTTTLHLGDGASGFSEASAGLTDADGSISIADVDGDGNLDLLITGRDANYDPTATLYLGDGTGGFSEAGAGLTNVQYGSTSIADVGVDGDPDLLVTGNDALFGEPSARLYVNRQNQTPPNRAPTFAPEFGNDYSLAPGVTLRGSAEAGDLDGDPLSIGLKSGPTNVSVNDRGNATLGATFTPTRSQGGKVVDISIEATDPSGSSGSFSLSVEVPPFMAAFSAGLTGVGFGSSSIADVDGDGNPDLLVTGEDTNGDRIATLYFGNGTGGFSKAGAGLTGVEYSSTSIADVDGDGNQDLLITGEDVDENLTTTLYFGDGSGGFSKANAGLKSVFTGSTSIADVDGDDNQDLLITGEDPNGDPTATLYLGDGTGGFSKAGAGLTGVEYSSTSIADVDGDGNQDLLITGRDKDGPATTLYLGDGTGSFSKAGTGLTGVWFSSTSTADVDGDGNQDLLITGRDAKLEPTTTLYLGGGTGGFSAAGAGLGGVGISSTSIADVDGDGAQDLLVTGFSGTSFRRSSLLYENLFQNPLPVELAGFRATANEEDVRLTWQTASETGNAGFRVQRRVGNGLPKPGEGSAGSSDGQAWTTVGRVEGGGTTTEARSYQFTDASLPYAADALTYRLKQVDTDGSVSYSDLVTVERGVAELELIGTYPNPARGQATVRFAVPEGQEAVLRLYDVLGRQVRTLATREQEGRRERQVDLSGLASGTYVLRLRSEGEVRTRKLTVLQ